MERSEQTKAAGAGDLGFLADPDRPLTNLPPLPRNEERRWLRRLASPRTRRRPFVELFRPSAEGPEATLTAAPAPAAEPEASLAPSAGAPGAQPVTPPVTKAGRPALPDGSAPGTILPTPAVSVTPEAVAPISEVGAASVAAPVASASMVDQRTSDPGIYHSSTYDRAAHDLLDAITRREPVVLLTGEAGTGKTTLCRAVMNQVDHHTFTTLVGGSLENIEDVLKAILTDFGVISGGPPAGPRIRPTRHELRLALRDFLRSLEALGAHATIFVDHAQNLSVEMIQRVCALAEVEDDRRPLQVVLVGRPELLTTFGLPDLLSLNLRVTARCTLGALSRDELVPYVAHEIAMRGTRERVMFEEAAFGQLYAASRGVPLIVSQIVDRLSTAAGRSAGAVIGVAEVESAALDLGLVVRRGPPVKRRRRFLATLVTIVVLLAVAGAAAWFFQDRVLELITRIGVR